MVTRAFHLFVLQFDPQRNSTGIVMLADHVL
jgi:hypothetical protein